MSAKARIGWGGIIIGVMATLLILERQGSSPGMTDRVELHAAPLVTTRAPAHLPRQLTLRAEGQKNVAMGGVTLAASVEEAAELAATLAMSREDPEPEMLLEALRRKGFDVRERRAGNPRTGERTEIEGAALTGESTCRASFEIQSDGTTQFSSLRLELEGGGFEAAVQKAQMRLGESARPVRQDGDVVRWELANDKALFVKKSKMPDGRERILLTAEYRLDD